jgi:hypothetical protein
MSEPNIPVGGTPSSRREFLAALAAVSAALSVPSAARPASSACRSIDKVAPPFVPEDTYPFFTEAEPGAVVDRGRM